MARAVSGAIFTAYEAAGYGLSRLKQCRFAHLPFDSLKRGVFR